MSLSAFMARAMQSEIPNSDTFHKFFDCWIAEQDSYLQELVSAAADHRETHNDDAVLRPLVERVLRHYEEYYQAKSRWEKRDAAAMLSPAWRSSLEDAFLWIGGWRPTMAVHLLYSKSGVQLEARFEELMRGLTTGDLGDLTASQMSRVHGLQKRTIRSEKDITEKLAKRQEAVADKSMVELSNAVSEMIRMENDGGSDGDGGVADARVESALDSKMDGLEEVLHMADELRLETLKAVIEILTPIQAVYFLIAAAELHLRLHEWGKKRDANVANGGGGAAAVAHNPRNGLHVQ